MTLAQLIRHEVQFGECLTQCEEWCSLKMATYPSKSYIEKYCIMFRTTWRRWASEGGRRRLRIGKDGMDLLRRPFVIVPVELKMAWNYKFGCACGQYLLL